MATDSKKKGKDEKRNFHKLLTVMIWRMERRRVAAATAGGNGNMAETFAAIWVDVTTQSRALLRLLRLTALRAMKVQNVTNGNGGRSSRRQITAFISSNPRLS
jgi:hypothetical protein